MEETKELVLFIVIASSAVVLLLAVVLLDLFLIFRKRRVIAAQEIALRDNRIDELLIKQEMEAVQAALRGQNDERRRISQELHDRLGGILFAAKLYNSATDQKPGETETAKPSELDKLGPLLDEALDEVRRISHDLYHSSRSTFCFTAALRQLITAVEASNGVKIVLNADAALDDTDGGLQQELYALTQEMLSNTLKHAEASQVEIDISADDTVEFRYRDDGKGFDMQKKHTGIGLANIRARAEKLGAEFSQESARGQGTLYYLSVPGT